MNTLQMINGYIEDIKEKEMEKFFISKEHLQKDIFENENLEKEMYDRFHVWLNTQNIENVGRYWNLTLLHYRHDMDKLPLCIKQEIIEVAKTTLFSKKVSDLFFNSFFHKKNVKRKSEKIKSVLSGENVKQYVWIEKEEEKKLCSVIIKLCYQR